MEAHKRNQGRIDYRGNPIDFTFCLNCVTFISIANKKVGDEMNCIKCHTD